MTVYTEDTIVSRLDVILNEEIEGFNYSVVDPSLNPNIDVRQAFETILRTATFRLGSAVERTPHALAALVRARPHARILITHYVRPDSTADGEMKWIGGGTADVAANEHGALLDRALILVGARIASELESGLDEAAYPPP
jgi:hypothetical protein